MALRIVITDDDAGMRAVLRGIIDSMEEMQCVGEAADGLEAVRRCMELKPDAVILDVKMPELDGVLAAKEISAALPDVAVVFCTAHSEFMPDAFDVYAADYLIKPFKTDRVRQTLRRINKSRIRSVTSPSRTIMLKNRDGMVFLPTSDILLIYRENRVTHIVTFGESYTTSESLSDLLSRLDGSDLFRCHRAFIINVTAISKVQPYGRWTYLVSLKGTDKTALITHEKLEDLQMLLGV